MIFVNDVFGILEVYCTLNGCDVNSILEDSDIPHVMPMFPTSVSSMISLKTLLSLFLFMFVTSKLMPVIIVSGVAVDATVFLMAVRLLSIRGRGGGGYVGSKGWL